LTRRAGVFPARLSFQERLALEKACQASQNTAVITALTPAPATAACHRETPGFGMVAGMMMATKMIPARRGTSTPGALGRVDEARQQPEAEDVGELFQQQRGDIHARVSVW
jgi:hypothetical protein